MPSNDFEGDLSRKIFTAIPTTTSALLIKKDVLERIGLFDEKLKFWQEYDLMIRLAQVAEFDFVAEPLLIYRIDKSDPQRLTNKYYPWKDAVKYVHEKHRLLLSHLTLAEKLEFHRVVASDEFLRINNSTNRLLRLKAKIKYLCTIAACKIFK